MNKKIKVSLLGALALVGAVQTAVPSPAVSLEPSAPVAARLGKTAKRAASYVKDGVYYGEVGGSFDPAVLGCDTTHVWGGVNPYPSYPLGEIKYCSINLSELQDHYEPEEGLSYYFEYEFRYKETQSGYQTCGIDERDFEYSVTLGKFYYEADDGVVFRFYGYLPAKDVERVAIVDPDGNILQSNFVSQDVTVTCSVYSFKAVDLPGLIDGGSQTVNVNLDSPVSLSQIKSMVSAKDLFGRDVGFTMEPVGDEYDSTALKLGSYAYKLVATDEFGQTATATLTIKVVDVKAPVVTVKPITKGYSTSGLTYDDLLGAVTATDKSTSAGGSPLTYKFTCNGQTIDRNTPLALTADMAKAGSVSVDVEVSDGSGNVAKSAVTVNVADDCAPVISRTNGGGLGDTISISLSMMNDCGSAKRAWLANFKAVDAVSGDCEVTCEGFPSSLDEVAIGETEVTLKATDSAGNVCTETVKVNITADESTKPYFVLDDLLLSTTGSDPLSMEDLANVAENSLPSEVRDNLVGLAVDDVTYNDYLDNSSFNGQYKVAFSYQVYEGAAYEPSERWGYVTVRNFGKDKAWYNKVVDFFKYGWQRFCNWFAGKGWKTDTDVVIDDIDEMNSAVDSEQNLDA